MLGAIDQTAVIVAGFGVVSALIAAAAVVIVAMLSRQNESAGQAATAAAKAAHSIGDINGHGDVHTSLNTVIARLDAQDRASVDERLLRDEFHSRQLRILDALDEVKAKQETFLTRDDIDSLQIIDELRAAVDRVNDLIGVPEPGWDPTPLLPYVHQWKHDLTNELLKMRTANAVLVEQVISHLQLPPVEPE